MTIELITVDTADPAHPTRDVAVDRIAGVDYQLMKLAFGVDGSVALVSAADPVPVILDAASLAALESITVALDAPTLAALETITVALDAASLAALESITATGPLTDTQLRAAAVPVSVALLPAALGGGLGLKVEGNLARDVPVTANPQLSGGRASTATPAAVSADGDAVDLWLGRSGSTIVEGTIPGAGTDAGNPVKVGGRYNVTKPTYTDGQRTDLQHDTRGNLQVALYQPNTVQPIAIIAPADTLANAQAAIAVVSLPEAFNGVSMDRVRTNLDAALALTSAARTVDTPSADLVNYNHRGVVVVLNMTVVGTGSVTLTVQGKDAATGVYYPLLVGAPVTTNVSVVYVVYPGATPAANAAASMPIPRTFRVNVVANNANAATYSVSYAMIV